MPTILVLFNLKPGASISDYETWAKAKDIPTVNGTETPSPYQYAELIEIPDMNAFFADLSSEAVQAGAKQFAEFADNPQFIVGESIG
jgi:hypothetical protein